jgi:maltokinase
MTTQTADVSTVVSEAGIADALPDIGRYINKQRWSGAQDSDVRDVAVHDAAVLLQGDPTIIFSVTRVTYEDGRVRDYVLPLGVRRSGDPLAERAPTFMIGSLADESGGRFLYDALGDPAYVHYLWQAILEQRDVRTARATLRCQSDDPSALETSDEPWVRVLTVEQSNTSIEVGERTFLKHMRRIEPGPSQELEVPKALTAAGFKHVAPILADVVYQPDSGEEAPLVLVQPYLRNSSDGWALALTSLRDLYADAEEALATGNRDVDEVVRGQGGAFEGESQRLGNVIGEMHLALAAAEVPGLRPAPVTAAVLNEWADAMSDNLEQLLEQSSDVLEPLRARRTAILAEFDALRELEPAGLRIRVHGDLHLGQTLRIDSGWILLDFEGEPNRTPAERRALTSPLRDVAGMLRSFDYAAAVALTDRVMPDSADWEGMMAFGDAWAAANRRAFWNAYVVTVAESELLPAARAAHVIRRAFELQKAVYEVGYELGHRPSWVSIPLRFLCGSGDEPAD